MPILRARVIAGRLVLNEPTELPEGAEVDLEALGGQMNSEERARLHAALDASDAEIRAGRAIAAAHVMAGLDQGAERT